MVGEADVQVGRHLAELHEGALHVAEGLGHLGGGAQLELLVELGVAMGAGEHPAGPVEGEVGSRPAPDPGQLGPALVAGATPDGTRPGPGAGPAPRGVPAARCAPDQGRGDRHAGGHQGAAERRPADRGCQLRHGRGPYPR